MNNWVSIEWFDSLAVSNGTVTSDAGSLDASTNPWSSAVGSSTNALDDSGMGTDSWSSGMGSSADTAGGSGVIPPISTASDYWLRNENNSVITDETGAGFSLEGI